MSFLYAVTFGGFVAFSTYLPTYLKDVYSFDLTAAGTRTAGFALAAVIARPIGGILSDRFSPKPVVADLTRWRGRHGPRGRLPARSPRSRPAARSSSWPSSSGSAPVACSPGSPCAPRPNGSAPSPASSAPPVGSAGFFPPLVMGATYDEVAHSYTIGLVLLCVTATVALVFVLVRLRNGTTGSGATGHAVTGAN